MQSAINETNNFEVQNTDVDVLIGQLIKVRLNQMSPHTAKKKRRCILKYLIDSDSDGE